MFRYAPQLPRRNFSCRRRPNINHFIHRQRAWQIVRDEQHRHFAFELIDGLRKLLGGSLIEAAGGFIKNQYLRALEQRARNGDTLFLPAG